MSAQDESSPSSFTPPEPGELSTLLPQYRVDLLIAAGGMGAVYRGEHRELERPVAIKILPPEFARDSDAITRFRTEAKAMARLTHPNIPSVFDFDVVQGTCYLVMEFVEGSNVHAMIHRNQLTPELTFRLLSQVCDALHFAHSRGVVHGDVKPANILVTPEGQAKLADFGLAHLAERPDTDELPECMGTLEYTAPEILESGGRRDHRSDIYSLGPVLYEMLTGSPPEGEFLLPAASLKLDPRVDTIIARCMEIDPAGRWKSAGEVRDLLNAILTSPQPPPGSQEPRPHVRIIRPRRRRRTIPATPPARIPSGTRQPTRPLRPSRPARPPRNPRTPRRRQRTGLSPMLLAGIVLAGLLAWLAWQLISRHRESPPPAPATSPPAPTRTP